MRGQRRGGEGEKEETKKGDALIEGFTLRTPTDEQQSPTLPPVSSPRVAANLLAGEGRGLEYLPDLSTDPNLKQRG